MYGGSRRRSVASAEPPPAGRVPLAEAFALNSFVAPTLKSAGPSAPSAPLALAANRSQAAPELEDPRAAFELPPRPGKRPAAPAVDERATSVRRGADPGADLAAAEAADTCAVVGESRRAASRRRQSLLPVHDTSAAPLSELLSPQAPASRQRRRSVAPLPGSAVDATGHAAVRNQVARLVQLADSLLPVADDAHVVEEEHLPLRERLADAWQGKSYYERLAAMASPAPVSKKPAARNPVAADLSPLSRAASAAAALNDDLQDVPGRPMSANPPPARMLSVLSNPPTARPLSRVVTTAAAAEVVVPAAATFQPAVMPASISAPSAPAPVIPVVVSAFQAASEASLAEARAEVMCVREQLLMREAQLQAEMVARRAAESAADAFREDLSTTRRELDATRARADAAASELAALRGGISAAASAVRGLITAAAADAEGRMRALI